MSKELETGGSAFPFGQTDFKTGQLCNGWGSEGMTLRQYAAIKLRVPDSGTDWLDEMILKSQRDELAAKAMQSLVAGEKWLSCTDMPLASDLAYKMANAMLEARKS